MKKFLSAVTAIIVTISTFIAPLASIKADGMVIRPYPDTWEYYEEGLQQVYINYTEGRQNMVLSIGLEAMSDNLVWIFPVPAEPNKVVIDNSITQMPDLYGEDITESALENIEIMRILLSMNQIYPSFFLPFFDSFYGVGGVMPMNGVDLLESGFKNSRDEQVTVYEHLVNNGITTELLTSDSSAVLQEYFDSKDLNISADSLTSLSGYFGKDYSFVISWISEPEIIRPYPTLYPQPIYDEPGLTYEQDQDIQKSIYQEPDYYYQGFNPGLLVSFPTDRIYFPLIPTSVYGSKVVPAVIKVMGLVTPDVFKDIESYTKVTYNQTGYYNYTNLPESFRGPGPIIDNSAMTFTTIRIDAPSKLLSEDLYIDSGAPLNVYLAKSINDLPFLFLILPLLVNSMLASTIASFLSFKEARSLKIWKYSLLGLTNFLSIIFTTLVLIFTPTKSIKDEDKALFADLKAKGYNPLAFRIADLRKLLFLPLFSILYLVFTLLGGELMKWLI